MTTSENIPTPTASPGGGGPGGRKQKTPEEQRQENVFFGMLVGGGAALLIACIGGFTFIPKGWGSAVFLGVLILAVIMPVVGLAAKAPTRICMGTVGILAAATVVLFFHPFTRPAAVITLSATLLLFPVLMATASREFAKKKEANRITPGWAAMLLLVGASLAASALGIIGAIEHSGAVYAIRYGDRVTVAVPSSCISETRVTRADVSSDTYCKGASWTERGKSVTGTLHVTSSDVGNGAIVTVDSVKAYTLPGSSSAYTHDADAKDNDGLVAFGHIPWWLLFTFPVLLAVALAVSAARNRRSPDTGGTAGA